MHYVRIEVNEKLTIGLTGEYTPEEPRTFDYEGNGPDFEIYDVDLIEGTAYNLVCADLSFGRLCEMAIKEILNQEHPDA